MFSIILLRYGSEKSESKTSNPLSKFEPTSILADHAQKTIMVDAEASDTKKTALTKKNGIQASASDAWQPPRSGVENSTKSARTVRFISYELQVSLNVQCSLCQWLTDRVPSSIGEILERAFVSC